VDALFSGPVSVSIDLVPDKDRDTLRKELLSAIDNPGQDSFRSIIRRYLPRLVVRPFVAMMGIPSEKPASQLTQEEMGRVLDKLKSLKFDIKGPYSMATAMVTAGGVSLEEIDSLTMASRLVKGLYFCGEVMDIDAETGGYNLQAAFSTGYVAGESAAAFVRDYGFL
jgi:predicted Rossmann fold flavoprotein